MFTCPGCLMFNCGYVLHNYSTHPGILVVATLSHCKQAKSTKSVQCKGEVHQSDPLSNSVTLGAGTHQNYLHYLVSLVSTRNDTGLLD